MIHQTHAKIIYERCGNAIANHSSDDTLIRSRPKESLRQVLLEINTKSLNLKESPFLPEYVKKNMICFIFDSNKFEGSKVSRGDTLTLILSHGDGSREDIQAVLDNEPRQLKRTQPPARLARREVLQHFLAYRYMQDLELLSEEHLRKVHAILTDGLLDDDGQFLDPGVYRTEPIRAEMHTFAHPDVVPLMMEQFMATLGLLMHENKVDPYLLAAWALAEFLEIHPFNDGNGRLARLIFNFVLRVCAGVPFYVSQTKHYMSMLKHYQERPSDDDKRYARLWAYGLEAVVREWNKFKNSVQGYADYGITSIPQIIPNPSDAAYPQLTGMVAMIAGSTSDFTTALCEVFLRHGAKLFIVLDSESLSDVRQTLQTRLEKCSEPNNIRIVCGSTNLTNIVSQAVKLYGVINFLINNQVYEEFSEPKLAHIQSLIGLVAPHLHKNIYCIINTLPSLSSTLLQRTWRESMKFFSRFVQMEIGLQVLTADPIHGSTNELKSVDDFTKGYVLLAAYSHL